MAFADVGLCLSLDVFGLEAEVGFRFRILGCPVEWGSADGCPAERTRRSAPPPPCIRAQSKGVLGWAYIGLLPMRVVGLPGGAGIFGWMSSAADTEVRAPAALSIRPGRVRLIADVCRARHTSGDSHFGLLSLL